MTSDAADRTSEVMLSMQNELLDAFEQAGRAWFGRVKSDMQLWSELATKLSATKSVPEDLHVYQKYVAQRIQMVAEDGQRLFDECQKITDQVTRLMSSGWMTGNP